MGTVTVDAAALLKLALTVMVCVPLLPSLLEAAEVVKETVEGKLTNSKAAYCNIVSGQ
jgi:hypothetical protein